MKMDVSFFPLGLPSNALDHSICCVRASISPIRQPRQGWKEKQLKREKSTVGRQKRSWKIINVKLD